MKLFVVAVFCFIAAAQAHSLTDEQLAKLKAYKADCIASSGVTPDLVEKSKKGEFADDPKLKEFLFCIGKKIGFLNDAGDFQVDVMTAKITANHGKDAADDVVSVCTAKKESSGPETSFALAKCLYEKSKQHITLA
ncbi:PREDICTED: B1 protein-like [Nicrophorus vespilloides]|uniref:B1 protein-like n=1 Tax=Nicrophorus vespilloides TaxID=110193 RepID=A0ABM1N894_NICVS|nr:PREDICTED: B1 protein-like [Nicrophorus vespilloides]